MQNLNVLKYYRKLFKECKEIKSYNFRDFFIRKLKYDFKNEVSTVENNKSSKINDNKKDLEEKLNEIIRIRKLQNLYFENKN